MTSPDLQQSSWDLNLIKNVKDTVVFLTRKVFDSHNFSPVSYRQDMRKSLLKRKHKWTVERNINLDIYLGMIRKGFEGYSCKSSIEGHSRFHSPFKINQRLFYRAYTGIFTGGGIIFFCYSNGRTEPPLHLRNHSFHYS